MRGLAVGRGATAVFALGCLALHGCVEERVVAVRGGLQNIPGAVGGIRPEVTRGRASEADLGDRWSRILAAYGDPQKGLEGSGEDPRRHVDESGGVTLILRSPADVMWHLYQTLQREEWDLLYEQVVSDRLKRNYVEHFREAEESLRFLRRNRQGIFALLEDLPNGELTPGAEFRSIGAGAFRITASPESTREDRFESIDVIIEDGVFRLLLIR